MAKKFYSIPEYAKLVGVSRITIYNKVKKGLIKASKVGRNYAIPEEYISGILGKSLSENDKKEIDRAVDRTIKEYGAALKLLGRG